jgi:hypothetical protein
MPFVPRRLDDIISATLNADPTDSSASPQRPASQQVSSLFHHYVTPTLPHLLALILHPPQLFPPKATSLLVIDSISTVIGDAYPRQPGFATPAAKNDAARWAAARRPAVLHELVTKLNQMAAVDNIAVLLTCQTVTRVRFGSGAILVPAISGTEWDAGVSTRLVLLRDWVPEHARVAKEDEGRLSDVRFVGVTRLNGATVGENKEGVGLIPFTIEKVS